MNPQVWSLGVKEVWKVARPLDRVIHTLGWPLRWAGKHGETGGSFIYPMGDDRLTIGLVVGLELPRRVALGARPPPAVQDPPDDPRAARGRRARGLGREDDPGGRPPRRCRDRISVPGAVLTGDSAGFVNVPKLKGDPLRHAVGHARRRDGARGAEGGRRPRRAGRARRLRPRGCKASHIWRDLHRVPEHAPGADQGPGRRRRAGERHGPHARARSRAARSAPGATPTPSFGSRPATTPSRTARSRSTSCRASSSRGTAAATTSPTTSASGERVPVEVARGLGRDVPGRRLRAGRAVRATAWSR